VAVEPLHDGKPAGLLDESSEMCRILGIGKRTVHAMRERGELPYSKLEHKTYFRTDDIIRLMDSHDSCGIPTANIQKISEKIKAAFKPIKLG